MCIGRNKNYNVIVQMKKLSDRAQRKKFSEVFCEKYQKMIAEEKISLIKSPLNCRKHFPKNFFFSNRSVTALTRVGRYKLLCFRIHKSLLFSTKPCQNNFSKFILHLFQKYFSIKLFPATHDIYISFYTRQLGRITLSASIKQPLGSTNH